MWDKEQKHNVCEAFCFFIFLELPLGSGSPFNMTWFILKSVVEQVDIELPEDQPLREAHEIGESLQIKIEELPEVERAFVHLDTECEHKPEHSVLNRLPNS